MTPIELSTRRRVTGLTSDEFARLSVSLQREVDGEAAHWSATDVESWELVGPPVTAEQHLIDTFAAGQRIRGHACGPPVPHDYASHGRIGHHRIR